MATEQLHIPDAILQDLRCSICAQYLSVFPVHMSTSLGAVCGRCTIEENNMYDAVRNTTYEKAIELFRFPCANDGFGCVEKLPPSMISAHERTCKFRQVKCPCIQAECDWKGPCTTIVDHFEDKHLVFLMKQPDFEVNFINTINEVYILLYEEEIFLFQRKADGHKNTLWYSLEYFGWNEKPENFSYQVTLTDMSKKFRKQYPKQATIRLDENVTEIVAGDVKKDLGNPSVIVGVIEITINDVKEQKKNGNDVKHKEISNQMLKILECPVCFEFMIPPIFQCLGGHSICSVCKNEIAECPTCRQPLKNTRNFVMEAMTKHILYPCKNAEKGCGFSIDGTKIRQHEKFCEYGSVECPLSVCQYQCQLSSLMTHILDQHKDNVLEVDVINEPLDDGFEEVDDSYVLKHLDKIFIVYFKAESNAFWWSFQLLGSPELVNSYKCEIDILDNTNNGQRIYLRGSCSEYTTHENAFDNDCYLKINYDQVKRLITDTFTYRMRVVKDVSYAPK